MSAIDFRSKVRREIENIEESEKLSDENRSILLEYRRDLKVGGLSDGRIHKLLVHTRVLAERLGETSFKNATEEDLKRLVEWIEDRDLSDATKRDYRGVLKRFYKWLNEGEYPEKVKWISTTMKKKNRKLPEKLLTEEDVKDLIDAAKNSRDRAFISLLWETGGRIGELFDLKVGSFEDREHGQKVVIKGKTGARRVPLISSVPYLNMWLSDHPQGNDRLAPLWCKLSNGTGRISYENARKILRRIRDEAGIEKPVNPHHFRHSRATYLANHFTEAQMCEYFGWVQGSDRPADYVHLSGRDIDVAYDRLHGFEGEAKTEKPSLTPRRCPRCDTLNNSKAKFCQKCGLALDERAAMEVEKKERMRDLILEKMDELDVEGSFEKLLERAVEEKVREILSKREPRS